LSFPAGIEALQDLVGGDDQPAAYGAVRFEHLASEGSSSQAITLRVFFDASSIR
jgi:hypothetical protein